MAILRGGRKDSTWKKSSGGSARRKEHCGAEADDEVCSALRRAVESRGEALPSLGPRQNKPERKVSTLLMELRRRCGGMAEVAVAV